MPLLEVKNLHTYFKTKKGIVKAVNDVSYSLEPGKTIGIVGESGSGKSVSAMSILQLIWKTDASVNVCPSIHCQSSACMALAFTNSRLAKDRPALKVLAWVWAALICASTVFTKQHSIIDVVCGLAVAFVWVPVVYRPAGK